MEDSAWETAIEQLAAAAAVAGISPELVELLSAPQRLMEVQFPVKMDDGKVKLFTGYRVHYNYALGPVQGGTRFHPDETLDDIKALALWMTVKNAVNQLPAGGGKGGVRCDPLELSRGELERVCRGYIRAIAPMLGSMVDFPGADVGTGVDTQSWMLDEWEQMHAMRHQPDAISGKGIPLGGAKGRPQATGLGVSLAVRETCERLGLNLCGLKVAVQGFGKVGSWAARILAGYGATVVGVSDVSGFAYNEQGLDITALQEHVARHGTVKGFTGGQDLPRDEIIACPCQVLIPAAVQSAITVENVSRVAADIIVEGANGPVTPAAERILEDMEVLIVPDIVANGGGTVIAYLERVQGTYGFFWPEQEVHRRYERMFRSIYKDVFDLAGKENITMRMAAWSIALRNIQEGVRLRGWI